ncbi:hypothetical protein HDV06_003860, partial [Boothiomyces sp. JEL0866]
ALSYGDQSNFEAAKKTLEEANKKIEGMKAFLEAKYKEESLTSIDEYVNEILQMMPRFNLHQYSTGGRSTTTEVWGNYQQQRMFNVKTAYPGSNMVKYWNSGAKKSNSKFNMC